LTKRSFFHPAILVALLACGDDSTPTRDGGLPDGGGNDAGTMDAGLPPECETEADCDDEIECTRDICDDRRQCVHRVDPAVCDDGLLCNGVEQCDPERGCMPGPPETCNDDDVCTIDRCDEEEKMCRRMPRDFDDDGEADWFCEGGTDCDDRDPTRGSTVAEICDDSIDNDCDGDTDESECGRPRHDLCEDALDVSEGGFFELNSDGASPDYMIGCAPPGRKDLVLSFTLDEPQNVAISAEGRSITYVELREECGDRSSAVQCASGFPGSLRVRGLDAGTYFVIIGDVGGEVGVEVEFEEPTPPPENETCASPEDVSAGGTFEGTFLDVENDITTACGSGSAPDLVYTFTTTEVQDVVVSAVSVPGDSMSVAVRSTCDDEEAELRCVRGAPAGVRMHRLDPGTYFLIVEGSATREFDFTLDVAFEDPTDPPEGDTCDNPIEVEVGTPITGTLGDKQDDEAISCGFFYRDAVYSFELEERSDVIIEADADGPFMYSSLRRECDDEETQLRCVSGNPSRSRVRDLEPGTYYVIVESFSGTGFDLSVTASEPTTPTAVTGNDNCLTAQEVPETGGLYTGNTTTLMNDLETRLCGSMAASNDAVFELNLTSRRRVFASTEGSSFDTVLHLHTGSCTTRMETLCDDDGGELSASLIDRELNAGTHFFVVDGWGDANAGDYVFEIVVTDP